MEIIITDGDIDTIEWIENALRDIKPGEDALSADTREKIRNAMCFLHRIKTNAKSVKKLQNR